MNLQPLFRLTVATLFISTGSSLIAQTAPPAPAPLEPAVLVPLPPEPNPPQPTPTTNGPQEQPAQAPTAPALPPAPAAPEPAPVLDPVALAQADFERISEIYTIGRNSKDLRRRGQALRTAVIRFEQFAKENSKHPEAQRAWYRRGVCHLLLGQTEDAEYCFRYVVNKFKTGQLVAASAFRLGANRYNSKNYTAAVPYFSTAAKQAEKPKVRLDSLIRKIHCLTLLKKHDDAIVTLKEVIEDPVNNKTYINQARMALALLHYQNKRYEPAFENFEVIANNKESTPIEKNKAVLYAGICASELEKDDTANHYLSQAISNQGNDPIALSKAIASLITIRHRADDSAGVLALYSQFPIQSADPKTQLRVLMYAGIAFADINRHEDAIKAFTTIDKLSYNTIFGFEASYRRLLSYYNLEKATIPDQVDVFLELHQSRDRHHEYIHGALLLKAETLYGMGQFTSAANTYTRIKAEKIKPEHQADLLYKRGWCLALSNDHNGAIRSFSKYLSEYPVHPNRTKAVAKRAESYLRLGNRSSALKDLESLKEKDSEVTPVSLQLHARVLRQEHKYASMIERFQQLITEFPNLSPDTIANAHYWIGWGHYKLEKYPEAITSFDKARAMVPEFYAESAGTHIVLSQYALLDAEELKNAISRLHQDIPGKELPAKMLIWLGLQRQRVGDFQSTHHFLTLASTPDEPALTELSIWRHLAKARLQIRHHEEALEAINIVLRYEKEKDWIADALLDKATCYAALAKASEAKEAANKGLQLEPQGAIKARLLMIIGDVYMAEKQYDTAASHYLNCAESFLDDKKVKPLALHKAIQAFTKGEKPDSAKVFQQQLRQEFPNWSPPSYPTATKAVLVKPNTAEPTENNPAEETPNTTTGEGETAPPEALPLDQPEATDEEQEDNADLPATSSDL